MVETVVGDNGSLEKGIKDRISDKAVAACPEVDIFIEGLPVRCLVDTGSQVTTITESFFEKLKDCSLVDIGKWIKITGANDLEVPYVGYTEVQMTVSNTLLPNVGVLVVKDPSDEERFRRKQKVPGLLGSNVFKLLKGVERESSGAKGDTLSQILSLYEMSAVSNNKRINLLKFLGQKS